MTFKPIKVEDTRHEPHQIEVQFRSREIWVGFIFVPCLCLLTVALFPYLTAFTTLHRLH